MRVGAEGLRIGELAQKVGVTEHTLRAWERRYGVLQPARTTGGYRLYSEADVRRINAVLALRKNGVTISEAVRRVMSNVSHEPGEGIASDTHDIVTDLHRAVEAFDEERAAGALDRLFSSHSFEAAVRDGLMPFLFQVGARWQMGEITVAHEHFASQLIRRRLDSYALAWGGGRGPLAVMACPPGELHDIPLLVLGVLLARVGWRIRFLGTETPIADVARASARLHPDVVVLSATRELVFDKADDAIRDLAKTYTVALGGRGAKENVAERLGAHALPLDVVATPAVLAELVGHPVTSLDPHSEPEDKHRDPQSNNS